ncbi:MAG TPA: hypothetical protein PK821_08500, partial [Victivallales bacterium]|nr:hypothetical protein [Victivallales bacterium]
MPENSNEDREYSQSANNNSAREQGNDDADGKGEFGYRRRKPFQRGQSRTDETQAQQKDGAKNGSSHH